MENNKDYEFNSFGTSSTSSISWYSIFDGYDEKNIKEILSEPIIHNEEIRKMSRRAYNTNPILSNGIDYIVSLPCLSHILTSTGKNKGKVNNNKELVESCLKSIKDKEIIRDFLFRDCLDGACYYYFETKKLVEDKTKFVDDYDMNTIYEINSSGMSISMIPLPTDYVKIRGYKNNRPVIAFNMEYFEKLENSNKVVNKLKCYPKEIRDGYEAYRTGKCSGNWLVLDNDKTVVHKIKSDKREPYGRPITISALIDVFYNDYLTNSKRSTLDEVNNKIIYQTLPEGEKRGMCSLTKTQQEAQHTNVKSAVMKKNNVGGTSFFTVSAGTKIDTINTNVDILNEDIEPKLNLQIAMGIGFALGLLDGETGSYSSQQISLELLFSKVYNWVSEIASELEYVINKNIIKDKKNYIAIYYLPTSLVNKDKFVSTCKDLYMAGSGSKSMWIASTGIDVNSYISLMEYENNEKWDDKFRPHLTSYTSSDSADTENPDGNLGGRPKKENATNDSTLRTQAEDSNNQPKPSTNN